MIPVQLTLKNFMSYGADPETLDFEGLHVACLSGDNGNGKSALLDAITWALWEKTRASSVGSISQDDLIRVNADEMEVRFEFELNEQRYRVVKKRRRGKSSGSDWQLAQADADGAWRGIGGSSSRETGKQIVQLLSMEYDTFLNSAYLQQGRADEFARQKPNERKRILGAILGLDKYDRLEEKARERWKERKEAAEELEREIRLLDAEFERLPGFLEQREAVCADLADSEQKVEAQEKVTAEWRDRRSKLDILPGQVTEATSLLQRVEQDIAQREKERAEKIRRLDAIQKMLDQKQAILDDYSRLEKAKQRKELLDPEIEAYRKADRELRDVRGAIDIIKTELTGELRTLEMQVHAINQRSKERVQVETYLAELTEFLRAEPEITRQLQTAQADWQAAQDAFNDLKARNERVKNDLSEIDEVLEVLALPRAVCPVCESDLSGKKQETVLARQQQKRETLRRDQDALKREGAEKKQAQTQAQETMRTLEQRQNAFAVQRSQQKQYAERRKELLAQDADADAIGKRATEVRTQLERNEYAMPQRIKRQRLESELERLGAAKIEYETTTQRIEQLEPTRKRYQDLLHAEGSWDQEVADRERLETVIADKQAEAEAARVRLAKLQAKLGEYEKVKAEAAIAERDLSRLHEERTDLRRQEAVLNTYIQRCEAASESRKARAAQHKIIDDERKIYQALTGAFGKRGVQALIIENAIPELEDEANALLARITDNAMQVRFLTTRAARTTNSEIETLDIQVQDDIGQRPYELFSGGEAFRINFAVRIALSRLLSRRAGARLQTLILDEGFGSQDGKGREKLVEVIETIKEDFEKILVITHVDELKDSFTQRIEVTKDASGSHIHVL